MFKRLTTLALALAMVFTFFACSPASETPNSSQAESPSGSDETVTLRVLKPGVENESPENARVKARIEEELEKATGTKVNLDFYYYDWDVFAEKYNLDIVSGNAPDLMRCTTADFFKYWSQGHFQPLDESAKSYLPNLQKRFSQGEIDAATINGKLAGIPLGGCPINGIGLIRQDKLDAIGKAVPTTLEELEDVFAAYKTAYPDEFPFVAYWAAGRRYIAGLCGLEAFADDKYLRDDGTVTVGYMHPDQKRYLELYNRWYQNGWVSKDCLTAGEEAEGQFIQDKGLMVISYAWYGLDFFKQTADSVNPNAKAALVPELKAPWGEETLMFDGYNNEGYLAVPKTVPKDKVDLICKIVNWELDSAENFNLTRRGEEGIDYIIEDGKMFTPDKWKAPDARPYNWAYYFVNSTFVNGGDLNIPDGSALPGTEEIQEQIINAKVIENPMLAVPYMPLDDLTNKYDAVTKELGTLQSEIIVGTRPLSDWDQAEKIWLDGGGAEIEAKMTEIYNSFAK